MSWHASPRLNYSRDGARSVVHYRNDGPLRILQSLYPEGDADGSFAALPSFAVGPPPHCV